MSANPSQVQDASVQTSSTPAIAPATGSANGSSGGTTTTTTTTSTASVSTATASTSTQVTSPPQEDLICRWNGCSDRFTTAEALYDHICERHVGRKSTNNLNLNCQWNSCRTTTVKRDHITSHIRVHVPLKPHKCDFCGKSFKRPQDLKKHVKTHADDSVLVVPAGSDRLPQAPRGAIGNPTGSSYQHYDHTGAIRTNQMLGQPHHNGQANTYSYQQTSTYGAPMYYQAAAAQPRADMFPGNTTASGAPAAAPSFESRKRSYEAVNDFFTSVKRREVDPTSYAQVGRSLMPLHNSLPINGNSVGSNYYAAAVSAATPLPAVAAAPALPAGVAAATPGGLASSVGPTTQHYFLPRTNDVRTKGDLLQVDRILEQMQGTVYESDPALTPPHAHPVPHYAPPNQVQIHHSQSPPHVHSQPQVMSASNPYPPHISAAHMSPPQSAISPVHSNGTPAVTPPSSSGVSYTSGLSPGTSSSAGFSPASRHSSTSSALYPSLSTAPSGSNITPTLGTNFEDKTRHHSGGLLQKPSRVLSSPPLEANVDHVKMELGTKEATEEVNSAASSPTLLERRGGVDHETWLDNVRCIEWLRRAIRHKLEIGDFEDDMKDVSSPSHSTINDSNVEQSMVSTADAFENLYPHAQTPCFVMLPLRTMHWLMPVFLGTFDTLSVGF